MSSITTASSYPICQGDNSDKPAVAGGSEVNLGKGKEDSIWQSKRSANIYKCTHTLRPTEATATLFDTFPNGVGAVISHQLEDESERLVIFESRTLSTSEKKISQLDK